MGSGLLVVVVALYTLGVHGLTRQGTSTYVAPRVLEAPELEQLNRDLDSALGHDFIDVVQDVRRPQPVFLLLSKHARPDHIHGAWRYMTSPAAGAQSLASALQPTGGDASGGGRGYHPHSVDVVNGEQDEPLAEPFHEEEMALTQMLNARSMEQQQYVVPAAASRFAEFGTAQMPLVGGIMSFPRHCAEEARLIKGTIGGFVYPNDDHTAVYAVSSAHSWNTTDDGDVCQYVPNWESMLSKLKFQDASAVCDYIGTKVATVKDHTMDASLGWMNQAKVQVKCAVRMPGNGSAASGQEYSLPVTGVHPLGLLADIPFSASWKGLQVMKSGYRTHLTSGTVLGVNRLRHQFWVWGHGMPDFVDPLVARTQVTYKGMTGWVSTTEKEFLPRVLEQSGGSSAVEAVLSDTAKIHSSRRHLSREEAVNVVQELWKRNLVTLFADKGDSGSFVFTMGKDGAGVDVLGMMESGLWRVQYHDEPDDPLPFTRPHYQDQYGIIYTGLHRTASVYSIRNVLDRLSNTYSARLRRNMQFSVCVESERQRAVAATATTTTTTTTLPPTTTTTTTPTTTSTTTTSTTTTTPTTTTTTPTTTTTTTTTTPSTTTTSTTTSTTTTTPAPTTVTTTTPAPTTATTQQKSVVVGQTTAVSAAPAQAVATQSPAQVTQSPPSQLQSKGWAAVSSQLPTTMPATTIAPVPGQQVRSTTPLRASADEGVQTLRDMVSALEGLVADMNPSSAASPPPALQSNSN